MKHVEGVGMSFSTDNIKHFSRKDVAYLCHCLSNICDNNEDEKKDQTSLKLECLTACYHCFRRKAQPINKNLSEDFARLIYLVVDLVQTDVDPFVLYASRKTLIVLLENETPQVKVKECLNTLLECLGDKEISMLNKTLILELTSDLLQGELTITVLDVIKQRFLWLVENVLKFPFQEDDSILITAFLIMWRKSTKKCQDLQLDLCWVMDYDILLRAINMISVTDNHIYSRQVIHLLKTIYSYGQILCLQTSVNPIYIRLGSALLQWAVGTGISNLHQESATGFGGTCVLVSCRSNLQTEFGNLTSLRQLAALLLSVSATIVRFSNHTVIDTPPIAEMNVALLDLPRCLSQLDDHASITVQGSDLSGQPFDWMTTVFGDQDDTLMEALLEVLDIYCITKKMLDILGPYLEKLTTMINPHRQFYLLLQMTGFDHSVLVDLLTSPETCALLYLTRYLKCVISEWNVFLETLDSLGDSTIVTTSVNLQSKSDSGQCVTDSPGANSSKNSQEDMSKCLVDSYKQSQRTCADGKVKTDDEEEQMIASFIPTSQDSSTESRTEMECNCPESQFVTDSTSSAKTQGHSIIHCVTDSNPCAESNFVKDSTPSADSPVECKSGSIPETERSVSGTEMSVPCMLQSTGLALLGEYSDDSDSEDTQVSNDRSESDSSKIVTQMETMEIESSTLSEDYQNIWRKQISERMEQTVSGEAKDICDNKLYVNQCLDETMATLIRLRLKMESLCESGLLVYHPGPLIRLITQCETLYEQ